MKALFIAAGPLSWGSSRMRVYWPAKYMESGYYVSNDDDPKSNVEKLDDYDAYIFQKVFDEMLALHWKMNDKKVFWDVCDPTWWWQPQLCRDFLRNVDGVVASSLELAEDFTAWSGMPCNTIPDRLDFEHFPRQREHSDQLPIRFVWYGVSVNRITLFAALANLERLAANGYPIELTIFDDRPEQPFRISDKFPIYHLKWDLNQENRVLASHDIALIPNYPGPWGRVKSNNKTLTAWACGLPVTDGEYYDEMEMLASSKEKRIERWQRFYNVITDAYRVEKSAAEWERLLWG